jgi:predicted small secreted protein
VTALLISLGIVVVAGPSFLAGCRLAPGMGRDAQPRPDGGRPEALRPLLRSGGAADRDLLRLPGFVYGRSWAR